MRHVFDAGSAPRAESARRVKKAASALPRPLPPLLAPLFHALSLPQLLTLSALPRLRRGSGRRGGAVDLEGEGPLARLGDVGDAERVLAAGRRREAVLASERGRA